MTTVSDGERRTVHNSVETRLRDGGHRYTRGRRNLVDALAGIDRPLTIPELVAANERLTQSSAYRNVAVLEELGVVDRILSGGEHARFELTDEVLGDHHHHVICTSCGRVEDFTVSAAVERTIEGALEEAVSSTGFIEQGHRLDVLGLCPRCAEAAR